MTIADFNKDINTVDNLFPSSIWSVVRGIIHASAIIGFTIYYVPLVATIILPWIAIALILTFFYRPAPLAIKRLEAPLSSQVLSCISEIVTGATTLRVSRSAERQLTETLYQRIDNLNRIHIPSFACHGWVTIRSSGAACVIYFIVGLFALQLRHSVIPGVLVILLVACLDVLRCLIDVVDDIANVQRGLNCVERLDHYAQGIEAERQDRTEDPKATWPSSGAIEMHNLTMRYRRNIPLALCDFNLSIRGGEKVGIVGRTGAGKSTILSVLLGFTDPCEETTTIDGVDITLMSVRTLRQALAGIPQDPYFFAGTVRSNLDPRRERTDEELALALQRTGLSPEQQNQNDAKSETRQHKSSRNIPTSRKQHFLHLDTHVSSGGQNLSSGQRQLLSLAWAIVRNSCIILIDEATASIDKESDMKIQTMIRSEFVNSTVLVIAHRIDTIKDYDRIAVLDQGRLVEFGTPRELWDCEGGIFRELCAKSGMTSLDEP